MLKPDTVLVQEIKVVPAKAKIMDMVAIRHPSSNADHRTTLILLCEDGSLRIYMAAMEQTGMFTLQRNVLINMISVLSGAFVIMNMCKRQQMEDKTCHMFLYFTWHRVLESFQTHCIFTFRIEKMVSAMASGIVMHAVLFTFIVSR